MQFKAYLDAIIMKPRRNGNFSAQNPRSFQGEGTNWILIAGGALLSTLSIRLGYRLKQVLDTRRPDNARHRKSSEKRSAGACALHSNMYSFTQNGDVCYSCLSGIPEGMVEVKRPQSGSMLKETDPNLPLVAIPAPESNRENGVMWTSSPDRLELPRKPFHHSNSSDSPCVSESGSDIFSKREVIQKLRQQLKRRDDMILEMQDQIMELQNSLGSQLTHADLLQSQLNAANRDLFDSEREIQRLRKAIADHCVRDTGHSEKPVAVRNWVTDNGHANGFSDGEMSFESVDKGRADGERIEMLKREVGELKEVIEGKDYLLQSYKEQKVELCSKVTDLQQRLVSQVPNIL
ncbi:hypothetical protein AQUCO_08100011v1 [Aquilegia coerulea]|uniref:Uncharacterized protein n=1 Tax=Aquilegia coerulea TaxID=218851 RepID=A0A2G5C7P0_AQUCA|nr:hypothetical protein AQUCO_08100011v1 [Aquilegia coerulea]